MSFDVLINAAIFAVALFLMVRFGCGRHMMGHSHAHAGAHNGSAGGQPLANQDIDPVCGMTVDRSAAITSTFAGRTYNFCSDSCRKKFEASPAAYPVMAVTASPEGHRHGCCG